MPNRVCLDNPKDPPTEVSESWLRRAQGLVPALTQTLAKGPGQFVRGVAPLYLERGRAGHVWDVDGNEYVDLSMGVGPLSLGYAYPAVDDAIRRQLDDGITFSLMHPLEVEVAELVREVVPHAESVRFGKTGAEAVSAAVRLARAYTGRERVLCCGYHGWHDWYIGVTDRHRGVPQAVRDLTCTFEYNDLDSLGDALEQAAVVVLEPMTFEAPRNGFLQRLREACDQAGTLLVFDEMWTGFRMALGGAQQRFRVRADLACFSKAVANGMPLSVLTGRQDVMQLLDRDVFFFTTFGGEALSLAAARATLVEMSQRDVAGRIALLGRRLRQGIDGVIAGLGLEGVRCLGDDSRTLLSFEAALGDPLLRKSLVQQELLRCGVLWTGTHNLCFSHTEADVDHVVAAYGQALCALCAAPAGDLRSALRGTPVEPVFRRTGGFNLKPARAVATR